MFFPLRIAFEINNKCRWVRIIIAHKFKFNCVSILQRGETIKNEGEQLVILTLPPHSKNRNTPRALAISLKGRSSALPSTFLALRSYEYYLYLSIVM